MSQVQMAVTDSLAACGFSEHDLEEMSVLIGSGAEITDENLNAMEPLQEKFARFLKKLPTTEIEDAEGNIKQKTDTASDAFKDFMKVARNMALDRLRYSQNYVITFAKVPTPTGALMWVDVSKQKDADGKLIDIDPEKYRHFTTTGNIVDPRQRFKTDDEDLVEQVILPVRKKMGRAATTTISRLKSKAKGGAKTNDPTKKLENAFKPIKAAYKWAKDEKFPVKDETAFNKWMRQGAVILGMSA